MQMRMMVLAVIVSSGAGGAVWAHGSHEPAAAKTEILGDEAARGRAADEVKRLVSVKKVDASWADAKLKSMEKKNSEGKWEWLATFENGAAAKDKLLYVFLKPSGEFVAANFTGK